MIDAALGYVDGFPAKPIFPAHPKTKLPLVKTGRLHAEGASIDLDTIRRWFGTEFPDAAIAMPCGAASGHIVIDADKKHDGEGLLAELESALGPLPRTHVVRTQSGGLHVHLAAPTGVTVQTGQGARSKLGRLLDGRDGIDVRADGGIVLLPPSNGYRWIAGGDDEPLAPVPKLWLLAINGAGEPPPAPRPPPRAHTDRRWSDPERGDAISEGGRNGALYARGVALRIAGATDAELLDDLLRRNAALCIPSLSEREVRTIAASASRATGRSS